MRRAIAIGASLGRIESIQRLNPYVYSATYSTRSKRDSRAPRNAPFRPASPRAAPENMSKIAYSSEMSAISMHSSLLNQITHDQILALEDINPMMQLFLSLPSADLVEAMAYKVVNALNQSAKDVRVALRTKPQAERSRYQNEVFFQLTAFLDEAARKIGAAEDMGPGGMRAVQKLFDAYKTVDPVAGVAFYDSMPNKAGWAGSVIPCMLEAYAPFESVRTAFETDVAAAGGLELVSNATLAQMTLACLKHDQIEAATIMFEGLIEESEDSLRSFLVDAMIGDAPLELALQTFNRFPQHSPHRSAMSRLLQRSWAEAKDSNRQIELFREYLGRLERPTELDIKPVATLIVEQVLESRPSEKVVVALCDMYGHYLDQHEVLLNLVLTQLSQKWRDQSRELILSVIANYENEATVTPISFRVRLNALEGLTGTSGLVENLWFARQQLGSLQKWDWLALLRATQNGEFFQQEWMTAGQPFIRDVRNFARSRRY